MTELLEFLKSQSKSDLSGYAFFIILFTYVVFRGIENIIYAIKNN